MEFNIRHPDISHLIKIGEKYEALIVANRSEIDDVYNKWDEIVHTPLVEYPVEFNLHFFHSQ